MRKSIVIYACVMATLLCLGAGRFTNPPKIDDQAVDGLTGVVDSLAYKVNEIEQHLHSRERWFGISGNQSGNDWATDTLTPFVAISGADTYGTDHSGGAGSVDEAYVLGTDDTPAISGKVMFNVHRLLILDVDHDTPYKLRIVYGAVDRATAVSAGDYSEVVVKFDAANPTTSAGTPVEIQMPRCDLTCMIWIEAWNASDDSQIDFLVGIHEYDG